MPMPPLALLAGGLATRLRPITETIPKSMVQVAGEPFIAHQLRLLKRNHITDIVCCVGHLGEQIEAFVGNGSEFGVRVRYSFDGPRLLGTGGIVKKAQPMLGNEFFIMYGDSYLNVDFAPIYTAFKQSNMPGLMTVLRNENRWDSSNIIFENNRIIRYDKKNKTPDMHYIDYGIGLLKAAALDPYPFDEPFDLADLYRTLVDSGKMAGYEVNTRFYEIGTPAGLAETEHYFREKMP